ncbi:MAG: hypothetical protein ABI237_14270 [Ginsengibacter sp.]
MTLIEKIKEKKLPAFIAKAILFLFLLIILDFTIGNTLRYLYFKQDSGLLYRTTYSLDSTKAELLIFGSSTANHHYNPSIFEKRLNTSVYNTGRDGNTIFYNYAVFQSVLKRYIPKVAILDFNVEEFKVYPDNYDRISSLLPYYQTHPELHSIIQLKSPYEKYKLLSKIYPYNSLIFTILVGNTDFNRTRDNINDDKGYVPLSHVWHRELTTQTAVSYQLDSNKINFLKSLIGESKSNGIRLYISISPRFIKYEGEDLSVEIVRKIANESNIPFFDFSKDTLFWKHNEYFADRSHLNNTGATIFSNMVIDKIIQNQQSTLINNKNNFSLKTRKK